MLREIAAEELKSGFVLPGALRDRKGRILIGAGTEITDAVLNQLGRKLFTGVYAGEDWPASEADGDAEAKDLTPAPSSSAQDAADEALAGFADRVRVDLLRVGMRLTRDIHDDANVLLLSAGSRITERFLHLLQTRAIRFVRLAAPAQPVPAVSEAADNIAPGVLHLSSARMPVTELWEEARRGLSRHAAAGELLSAMSKDVAQAGSGDASSMRDLVQDLFGMLALDRDLLITVVALQRSMGEYLFDHCVNVALISMSVAAQMGMSRDKIHAIGLGAMFQDVGMLRVPERIRLAPRGLTADERDEIRRHPLYAMEFLQNLRGLPHDTPHIASQTHEREDRSGYPRQRSSTTIHPLAKIVSVADCFAAMVQPRPHRDPLIPHNAIREILHDGHRGTLCRSVLRATLDHLSVFPIGSEVELSNGLRARVVRANPGRHTQPVVAESDAEGNLSDETLDLAENNDLRVIKAHPYPMHTEPTDCVAVGA
jgi:HD-GYP domain-containing protein (c-di-GMP phosphodiesterase class II)